MLYEVITKSKDELGELANLFNMFLEKLQKIISQLASSASSVDTSAQTLSKLSHSMLGNTKETDESVITSYSIHYTKLYDLRFCCF